MYNYDNDKIRIPNETYCPSKKIQFNSFQNNPTSFSSSSNNNINSNNTNINPYSNNIKSPPVISNTTTNININSSTNFNLNINIFSQDNSSEEGVTISPIKSIITSASSKPQAIFQPQCKLEKFLPPKTSPFHKTLVLDLDETLIHSYFDCASPRPADLSYDIIIEKKKIHVNSMVRPGAREFLENVATIFEIVIFTASLSEYANPLLDFIDKNKKCKFRLYREHCCSFNNGFTNSFTKDLKKLDRDMKNLIIIDNNPKSYMLNKENGVPIKTWVEDINDRELYKLIPYLLFLGNEKVKDVRPFLKQVNSGNSLNYDKFDRIILKYNTDNAQNKKEDNSRNTLTNNNKNINSYFEKNSTNKENKNINENINNNSGNMKNNYFLKDNKIKIKDENNSNTSNNNIIKDNKNIIEYNNPNINCNLNPIDNKKIICFNNENPPNKNEEIIENIEITNSNNNSKENNSSIRENNTNENINKSNNRQIKINKRNNTTKNNNNNNKCNTINENIIKINKNKVNDKINKSKEIIKNKSSNDMMNNITININNSKNNIIKEYNKEFNNNNKNSVKNNKIADKNIKKKLNPNKSNKSNNYINKENQNSNIIKEKNFLTNQKREIIIKKDDNVNNTPNINKRNKSVTNKEQYNNNNQFNENNTINNRNDIPYRIKYNNKGIKTNFMKVNYNLNNRYENIFKEEDNLEIEEYNSNENDNINNIIKIQREVKNSNNNNFIYNSTQELTYLNKKEKPKLTLSIHTAKSTSNINTFKNKSNGNNNKKELDNHINENDIINKLKKEIKIDIINNLNPTNDLLDEYMKNLNKANSLKSNTNSINKKIQLTEENYEKTIVNDDIGEEEKNENKEKDKDNKIYGENELFDDIDTEKDDINDYNIILSSHKIEENNNNENNIDNDENENDIINFKEDTEKENKKKYFEADDAFEYNKNKDKEKFIQEINENESNTINAKSSLNKNKRKFNKNYFNKSKPYPISNKKELKINRNGLFINRYQSGSKNGQINNNNFLPPSSKILPKDFFNYSTRKQKEIIHNNISSSNYKLFKEKAKTNLYLKYNSNNNNDNIELLLNKNKPISKHNSNVLHFKNNPKTNRNKNTINENQKISLFKSNNYINNIKNIGGIKSNNNEIYLLKNNPNEKEKKIIKISNRDNNLLSKNPGQKIKRPISCANKRTEKIFYNAKNNGNYKTMKFANQGKKIYLKTVKTSINTDNINNANNNLNDKLNKSNDMSQDKNNNDNIINLTNKNYNTNSAYTIVSPSGNIITDILFVRNIGEKNLKTTKGKIKYNNFYEEKDEKEEKKEEKEKRIQSAMNGKIMVNNSKNILL